VNLLQRALGRGSEQRYTIDDWAADKAFQFGGMSYPLFGGSTYTNVEQVENSFRGYTSGAYKANGVVFACVLARMLLFSEARFQWQRINNGRPGDLFGTPELAILETPWPNGTTGELLSRMEQDVSLSGNFFAVRERDRIRRLRPDWVEIILTAPPSDAVESDVIGYRYTAGGIGSGGESRLYVAGVDPVCHWSPIPDPDALYRGMSWITPVINEITADKAATIHKGKFFTNGATPSLAVSLKETVTPSQFAEFVEKMDQQHQGVHNAYKTVYLGGGADVTALTADLKQLDFKNTQGAGETRICADAGVPPIIVGLSEGLQAATYSNYGMARRKFGDHWARPQWRSGSAALASLVRLPRDAAPGTVRLWHDDRDIAFLREDEKDRAEIQGVESRTIRTLLDAGYTAESVKTAVTENDWSRLEHSGLFSVQLQPANSAQPSDEPPAGGEDGDQQ